MTGWWLLALVPLGLAVLSKESAIIGIVLVWLIVWAKFRKAWMGWMLMWHVVVVGIICLLAAEASARTSSFSWVILQSCALLRLLWLYVVPVGLTVEPNPMAISILWQVAAWLLLVALGNLVWHARKVMPIIACGIGWILLSMLPRFLVQPQQYGDPLNEHQFFLALVGVAIVVAGLVRPGGIPSQLCEEE